MVLSVNPALHHRALLSQIQGVARSIGKQLAQQVLVAIG
jgi:hypothetical protein